VSTAVNTHATSAAVKRSDHELGVIGTGE
jgi:hypothetical protein